MPKKGRKFWYSGKKKRHTIKTQVVADKVRRKIICTSFANGKRHDFRIFKESGVRVKPETELDTDSGYQEIARLHAKSVLPKKRSKKNPLTAYDKRRNREISSFRVMNEHIIGFIKRFKIIADRYRNQRRRFGLRFNLICGIYNFELNA